MSAPLGLLTFFMGAVVGFIFAAYIGGSLFDEYRVEAIRHGYAEWIPNEKGETKFQWKESAK